MKAEQTPVPRGTVASKKRRVSGDVESPTKKPKQPRPAQSGMPADQMAAAMPYGMSGAYQPSMVTPTQFKQQSPYPEQHLQQWQQSSSYMYPDPGEADTAHVNNGPYHQQALDNNMPYSVQSLEQLANEVLDSRYVNDDEDGGYTMPQPNDSFTTQPAIYHAQDLARLAQQVGSQQRPHHSADSGVIMADELGPMAGHTLLNGEHKHQAEYQAHLSSQHDQVGNQVQHHTQESAMLVQPTEAVTTPQGNRQSEHELTEVSLNGTTHNHTAAPDSQASNSVAAKHDVLPPESPLSDLPNISPEVPKLGLNNIPLYQPPVAKQRAPFSGQEREFPGSVFQQHEDAYASPSLSGKMNRPAEDGEREKSTLYGQDEESMRLARALQDEDWGLRSRRSK